jgi:hypothetical protein
MVYSPAKVVACIKVDGKILREDGNSVVLPFGSEYSVLVKNLNSVRIKVRVSVDGTDATEGVWLVVDPNADLELERFIRNKNLDAGNRFKFIERTAAIEEHRGIKADDGLIRIEYQVEKLPPVVEEIIHRHVYDFDYDPPCVPRYPKNPWYPRYPSPLRKSSPVRAMGLSARSASMGSMRAMSAQRIEARESLDLTETGITVPGSESDQKFSWTTGFSTGPSEVIVLRLRGIVGGKKAVKAVTVKMKPQCQTCGKTNKAGNKFCSKCGTALSII